MGALVPVSQVSNIKVQSSISHTPEGTNPARVRLIDAGDTTIVKVLNARKRSIDLCRRPIAGGGELIKNGFISKS